MEYAAVMGTLLTLAFWRLSDSNLGKLPTDLTSTFYGIPQYLLIHYAAISFKILTYEL